MAMYLPPGKMILVLTSGIFFSFFGFAANALLMR